jgi:hypothetical protein
MIKQQVRLNIGVLRTLSQLWPIGRRTLAQVQGIAQEMFAARKTMQQQSPWGSMGEQEILQSIVSAVGDSSQLAHSVPMEPPTIESLATQTLPSQALTAELLPAHILSSQPLMPPLPTTTT